MVYSYTRPRGPIAAMFKSPGPAYGLPSLTGTSQHDPRSVHNRAPTWAFGLRHGKLTDDCSPGPAYFLNPKVFRNGNDGTPHYSLYDRTKALPSFNVPGPGAYAPEHSGIAVYTRAPAYSMRQRTRLRSRDGSPAPNAYHGDSMLGRTVRSGKRQAPCFSMAARSHVGSFCQDLAKAPAPGTYNTTSSDITKTKAPGYSMTARNRLPGDTTAKPGPGAHSPEKCNINKRSIPSCSFGIRHSEYTAPLIIHPHM